MKYTVRQHNHSSENNPSTAFEIIDQRNQELAIRYNIDSLQVRHPQTQSMSKFLVSIDYTSPRCLQTTTYAVYQQSYTTLLKHTIEHPALYRSHFKPSIKNTSCRFTNNDLWKMRDEKSPIFPSRISCQFLSLCLVVTGRTIFL
jgi:hypothetical protein